MSIKKLSLAAVISIGIFTVGVAQTSLAQCASQTCCPTANIPQSCCPIAVPIKCPCCPPNASAYGVGAAGSFSTYGTLSPYGGNTAGATEISTMRSPVSLPIVAVGASAGQGCYGECQPCQTGGAASIIGPPSVVTIQKQVMEPGQGCAASISTPNDSNLTGGAAAAESQGFKCVQPAVKIPIATIGATACSPVYIPNASCGTGSPIAPQGFAQPQNPNINAYDQNGSPTGGACPTTCKKHHWWQYNRNNKCQKPCASGTPSGGACPITPASVNPLLQQPMNSLPVPACPQACPEPCQPTCPVAPTSQAIPKSPFIPVQLCTPNIKPSCACTTQQPVYQYIQPNLSISPMYAGQVPYTVWQNTGGACSASVPTSITYSNLPGNTGYIKRQIYDYPSIPATSAAYVPADGQTISLGNQYNGGIAEIYRPNMATNLNLEPQTCVTGAAAPTGCSCGCGSQVQVSGAQVLRGAAVPPQTFSIQSCSTITLQRMVVVPMQVQLASTTGAAAAPTSKFSDISPDFWASNSINKLASSGIVSGFPDSTFKPNLSVSRAEFSTMLVNGLNLQKTPACTQQIFKDVPNNYWASRNIDMAFNKGLVNGYPNNIFRPSCFVSRAEALTTISKAVSPCVMTACEATAILNKYSDANQVPEWATISVAKALKAGILQNSQNPCIINPNQNATRADVASMLTELRQLLAIEPAAAVPCCKPVCTGTAATIQQQTETIPTINVQFKDRLSARTSHVGDKFVAVTLEPVTVNGICFPQGSTVKGKVVEVMRPTPGCTGALKLSFTGINSNSGCQSSALPKEVIVAQVQTNKQPNLLSRIVETPFVWTGRIIGVTGRTAGSMVIIAGDSVEQVFSDSGVALGQLVVGNYSGAGQSGLNSAMALGGGVLDIASTALSGAGGLFSVSADEFAYLTYPNGSQVAAINPKERVSIAFGCQ